MVVTHEALEKVQQIADHYGINSQLSMAQEECAELIQAISKHFRACSQPRNASATRNPVLEAKAQVAEEMADVWNMLLQIEYLLDNGKMVSSILSHKLDRTLRKIQEESHES